MLQVSNLHPFMHFVRYGLVKLAHWKSDQRALHLSDRVCLYSPRSADARSTSVFVAAVECVSGKQIHGTIRRPQTAAERAHNAICMVRMKLGKGLAYILSDVWSFMHMHTLLNGLHADHAPNAACHAII